MPNLVDNRLVTRGKMPDLDRFLANHVRATAWSDDVPQFDFDSIVPVTVPHSRERLIAAWGTSGTPRRRWCGETGAGSSR